MSYFIEPTGILTYKLDSQDDEEQDDEEIFEIESDSLVKGGFYQNAKPSFKGDDETWIWDFSINTEHGNFKWEVQVSSGMNGESIENWNVTEPKGIEIIDDVSFEIVEVEDEYDE